MAARGRRCRCWRGCRSCARRASPRLRCCRCARSRRCAIVRADRHRDQHAGEVEVGTVVCAAADLERPVDAGERAADGARVAGIGGMIAGHGSVLSRAQAAAAVASAWMRQRRASSTLNAFWLCGLAPRSAASAAAAKRSALAAWPCSACSASGERQGRVPTPPSATRACVDGAVVGESQYHRGRGQRELVGGAIAQLEIVRTCAGVRRRQGHMGDQVARLAARSRGAACRRAAGRSHRSACCARPLRPGSRTVASSAISATFMSDGLVAMQCSLVPRIASVAVEAVDRRAAGAGLALVARHARCRGSRCSACAAAGCRRWSPCCAAAATRRTAAPATAPRSRAARAGAGPDRNCAPARRCAGRRRAASRSCRAAGG